MSNSIEKYLRKYPIRFLTNVMGTPIKGGIDFNFIKGKTFGYFGEENIPPNWYYKVTPNGRDFFRVAMSHYTIDLDYTFKQMSKAEMKEYNGDLTTEVKDIRTEAERLRKEEEEEIKKRNKENGEDKTFWYWLGAGVTGLAALTQENTAIQVVLGGVSTFCVFKALDKPVPKVPKLPIPPKLPLPQTYIPVWAQLPKIGKLQKSTFIPVYKEFGVPELGWKSKSNIKFAINKPGVYMIKRNNQLVYIGSGSNVYKTVLRHFEHYAPDNGNKQEYWRDYDNNSYTVRIVLTKDKEQAFKLEMALLKKYKPRDNKQIPEDLFPQEEKLLETYNDIPAYRLNVNADLPF